MYFVDKDIHEKLCMMDGKLETHMEVTNEKLESLEEEHRTQHQNITEILQSSVHNITQSSKYSILLFRHEFPPYTACL